MPASFLGPFKPLTSAKSATSVLAVAPAPLALLMQEQLQTDWCWAATVASVASFYRAALVSQCEVATRCLGMPCCIDPLPPPPPPYWDGNQQYALSTALSLYEHLSEPIATQPLPFGEIVDEITRGRPVCCHIQFGSLDGHFNAIVGCDPSSGDLAICDPSPQFGNGVFPYEVFRFNYHGGAWDQTYRTRPRAA